MKTDDKLLQQAVAYFRTQSQGYDRLFRELKRKYRSLGYLGGKVSLRSMTLAEAEALTGLLNRPFDTGTTETIRVTDIEQGLMKTKFSEVTLQDILEGYFGESLVSKKEEQLQNLQVWNEFWEEVLVETSAYNHRLAKEWIQGLSQHEGVGAMAVRQWWNTSPQDVKRWLLLVVKVIHYLDRMEPTAYIRLPVLSTHMTGYPHAFDMNSPLGRLLLYALCYIGGKNAPTNSEDIMQILYDHRILRDDLSSQVVVSGICGKNDWGSSEVGNKKEVVSLPLRTVVRCTDFEPYLQKEPPKRVWIVENPSVFSSLLDQWEHEFEERPLPPLVCSSGQFSLAVLALCDRLVSAGCQLHYSGDFDPEGFQMAVRLWRRYGAGNILFWRYTPEDYASVTQDIHIEEWRWNNLHKLIGEVENQGFPTPFVQTVKIALQQRTPVYQESLVDQLYNDIKSALISISV
ncbi:uncharacterized protein (TIGR02679 family) [Brevibacillus sp. AG162]|uniref:TIGR02679 domain-containing protein n=1 Tax=Brevibacillus sp. AG162 TaxID=2572910 RepID=UPI00116FC5E8|nr:TIGR02679 domain-containing protein [Brevibacillus sp. AG162]TQK53284.1 uncharacterized protein (TIGR02679 family) [Brevibacillus sp. AG162]